MDRKSNRKGVTPKTTAMLTGVAVCAKCGGNLYRITCGGPRNRSPFYRCHGDERMPSACKNLVPLAELDAWVDAQMRSDGSFMIETTVTPGIGYDAEISDVEADLRVLDFDAPDFIDRQGRLLAERARLRSLPNRPAEVPRRWPPGRSGTCGAGSMWPSAAPGCWPAA